MRRRRLRGFLVAALSSPLVAACAHPRPPETPFPPAASSLADERADGVHRSVSLRVVSFNASCLPPPLSQDVDGRVARMPAALRALGGDLFCLQEVWWPGTRSLLERAFSPEYTATQGTAGGLIVLSRFPVVTERFTRFPHVPGMSLVEVIAGKGMLEVQIETPLGLIRVVDAHLASGDAVARDAQLRFMLAHVGRDLPLVVAADTNFWKVWRGALTPQYDSMLAAGWLDAAPPRRAPDGSFDAGDPTRPGWPRDHGDEWGPTFPDHVLYAPAAGTTLRVAGFRQALDTPQSALSDHNALVADFLLGRAEAPD